MPRLPTGWTSRVLRITPFVPVFLVLVPATAMALVMCIVTDPSTGQLREGAPLRLRTTCRSSETQVDPLALGLQGPRGKKGMRGAEGRDGVDGVACWDLDADFVCDPEEDLAEPFGCGPTDCAGPRLNGCTLRGFSAPPSPEPIATACESGERCVIGQCNGNCGSANLALLGCDHQIASPLYARVVCCQ